MRPGLRIRRGHHVEVRGQQDRRERGIATGPAVEQARRAHALAAQRRVHARVAGFEPGEQAVEGGHVELLRGFVRNRREGERLREALHRRLGRGGRGACRTEADRDSQPGMLHAGCRHRAAFYTRAPPRNARKATRAARSCATRTGLGSGPSRPRQARASRARESSRHAAHRLKEHRTRSRLRAVRAVTVQMTSLARGARWPISRNRNPGSGCRRVARIPRRLRRPRSRGGGLGQASLFTEKKVGRRRVASGRRHLTRRSLGLIQCVTSFSASVRYWRGPVLASRGLGGRRSHRLGPPLAGHMPARDSGMSEIPLHPTLSEARGHG